MYAYDGDGAKVWEAQQVSATTPVTTVYLGAVELTLSPTGRITRTYYFVHGQRIALREQRSDGMVVYFLHNDALGSASLGTGLTGTVLSSLRYTPYGLPRGEAGRLPTPYRYTGQREMGVDFYDYQARLYDPAVGRFVQADTVVPEAGQPQSLNRYSYALGNPVKYNDPSGHDVACAGRDASACGTPSPLLEFYGPNWDFQAEPGPDEFWYWFDQHPWYNPDNDPVMQNPEHFGVNWSPGPDNVRRQYHDWLWIKSGANPLEHPALVEGAAEIAAYGAILGLGAVLGGDTGKIGIWGNPRIYRSASGTPDSLTPRPGIDDTPEGGLGLSFWDDLENPNIKPGKYVEVDPSRFRKLQAIPDNNPPGHVTVRPLDVNELTDWAATRGTGQRHPLTEELLNAIVRMGKK